MKNKPSSVIFLLLAAAIWGFAFVAQVAGGEHLSMFYFNGIRFLLGGVALIPVVIIFEKNSKASNKTTIFAGIVAGAILCTAANLQQCGINITGSSGKGGFLTAMYSVIVPVLAMIFMKKRTGRNTWLGAIISLVGLFMILSGNLSSSDTPLLSAAIRIVAGKSVFAGTLSVGFGDILLLLCAVAFAFHVVFIDCFSNRISPIKFSSTQFITCGIISLLIAFFTEAITPQAVQGALVPILYSALMSTAIAYTLQVIGQKGAHPTVAAIVMSTESMFAAIGGALLLGERMSSTGYIGCVVMLAGVMLAQIPSKAT